MTNKTNIEILESIRNYINLLTQNYYKLESLNKEQQDTIQEQKEHIRNLEFPNLKNT
jgi:hypothetical protein